MAIHQKTNNLFLVDLDQPLEGFRQFISCWIYKKQNKIILIDPGPLSTIPVLRNALAELGIAHIDYILLTHIHIDHAGGAGALLDHFPLAHVICHPRAIPHMIDPEKLWRGSLEVLGDIARTYKEIVPVPQNRIFYSTFIDDQIKVDIIETPGHALHHLNFLIDGFLFAGEVAGVNYPMQDELYLRIATPPRFVYEIYKDSLYKAADLKCQSLCFGHYDMRRDVTNIFDAAKQQLELWIKTVSLSYNNNHSVPVQEIFERLIEDDPCLASFNKLEDDIRKREKYFALNSIKGMLDYIQRSKNTDQNQ